jgi:uncharacterized protein (DUF302 family)
MHRRTSLLRLFAYPAFALAAVFALASTPALADMMAMPGWSVTKTNHSYKDLIARVDAAVKANKMGLVTRASATVGAASLGKTIPGNMVIGVYRPDFAIRMLEASVPAGIEAPIRLYVTENPDNTATLSYKLPSTVFAPYSDGGEALKELAGELDGIFAKIVSEATAQ